MAQLHFLLATQEPVTIYLEAGREKKKGAGSRLFQIGYGGGGGGNVCIKKFRGVSNCPLVTAVLLRAKTYHKANISEVRACVESKISLRFSCLILFSLVGHLIGFILVGNVFRKAFRILRLNEREDIGG